MPQHHQENQEVGLFDVVRFQGTQSIASAAANTWTTKETATKEFLKNQSK